MNHQFAKILKACRAASKYARGHRWEAGIMLGLQYRGTNAGFKPTTCTGLPIPRTFEIIANSWEGEFCSWERALRDARLGTRLDFYVHNSEELVTNVFIMIVSEREAVMCDCGGSPVTVTL